MIYLIYNNSTKNVKIGYSNNPKQRLLILQTGNDSKLELLFSTEGSLQEEKIIHNELKDYCLIGEWYEYNKIRHILPNLLKGWVDIDLDYTQFYHSLSKILVKIDSNLAVKLLSWSFLQVNDTNMFPMNDYKMDEFNEWLKNQNCKPYNKRSIYTALKELIDKKIVLKWSNGSYQLNPIYTWADDTEKRIEHLRQLGKYEEFEIIETKTKK